MFNVSGQEISDTINISAATHQLNTVEVNAVYSSVNRATSPLQVLQGSKLQKINSLQVSDAVKFFSGVQVKDYGGVGGLKTVSIRSLGANHTAVAYDGITLTDYQTGQIDLGRFSLDNVEMLSLNIGESDDIFQAARMQSTAGVLNIVTKKPQLSENKTFGIKAGIKYGSLNLINPSVLYEQYLNKVFSTQVSVEWLKIDGDYPLIQYRGYDNKAPEKRKRYNSDVETLKTEWNLFGNFSNDRQLSFKASYNNSNRGLPSSLIYDNDYSAERLYDENAFFQAKYIQSFNKKLKLMTHAKFNYSYMEYEDRRSYYDTGSQKNEYYQREYYLNATLAYQFSEQLSFSWANDGIYGNFNSNLSNNRFPSRTTFLSAISGKYMNDYLTVTGSVLSTYVNESVKIGNAPDNLFDLSPYVGFSVTPLKNTPLKIRGFYKHSFRLPTFGDLYFSQVTPQNLKPEKAVQYNVGLLWSSSISKFFPCLSISTDLYYNQIENKIIATPGRSLFIWTVKNFGKVEIKGIDVNLKLKIQASDNIQCEIGTIYTYQDVLDKNKDKPKTYNQRIPYTARHSGSGYAFISTPWVDVNYTAFFCGDRYTNTVNFWTYRMEPYSEHSISLSRTFHLNKTQLSLNVECLNLLDEQYEVVENYPMQGRSFRAGIRFIF
ncbi:MAG: TonB-dependent receptor [Dysgonamonadaceae bacterium]|jgi:outer membrane cobalamin receptor|nr:TonB-dependent receptor [Dysgonamonadaceae bacterium]